MIGRLSGNLILIEGNLLLLDVAGVGYEVEVSAGVLANSPQTGLQLTLFTHFVVREEAQLLFGFADQRERDLFRAYIRINGVGPKMALALISSISPAALASAVQANEVGVLTKVPGVGKRTAERLMVELKSRLDTLLPDGIASLGSQVVGADRQAGHEAEEALLALGYKPVQAADAVQQALQALSGDSSAVDTEQLVTWVLRSMGKG
ncbi:MAG: Holliday junction branch migration protein RuvA [Proteobacteria bacterium]|nr:Holliday junction branch migration protein RuvA [Pseudomonadota bacterium]